MNIEKADSKITNLELVDAINEMRKNFNPETQNNVLNLVLRSTFLVPCVVSKDTQLIADENNHVHFDEKPQLKFLMVTHKEKGTFFPVFTDSQELSKFKSEENYQGFAMKFPDLAMLTEQTPSVNGFVINPMGQNLPITKALLAKIKEALMKARQEREAGQSKPDITMTTNPDK